MDWCFYHHLQKSQNGITQLAWLWKNVDIRAQKLDYCDITGSTVRLTIILLL